MLFIEHARTLVETNATYLSVGIEENFLGPETVVTHDAFLRAFDNLDIVRGHFIERFE